MSGIGPISQTPAPLDLWVGPFDPRMFIIFQTGGNGAGSFFAFQVHRPITVSKAGLAIGTSSGHLDLGIYDATGHRLASTGSTASPGSGPATVNFTAPVTLVPGVWYYAAVVADNGTITWMGGGGSPNTQPDTTPAAGFWLATVFPLPTTITIPGTSLSVTPILEVFS